MGLFRYTVLRYPERFAEICALRRLAYGEAGKSGPDAVDTDLPDERDLEARVVVGLRGETLLSSIRLNLPMVGSRLHSTCRLRGDLNQLPRQADTSECGWGCVHPDYKGRGLLWELAAHMVLAARRMGRPYVLSGTDAAVWPMWQRVGYRKTDVTYTGALSGNRYWVMVLDLEEVLSGERSLGRRFAAALENARQRLKSAATADEVSWFGV